MLISVLPCLFAVTGEKICVAPDATVPKPVAIEVEDLPSPFGWAPSISMSGPVALEFHVDLDLLAPLGDGKGNAAKYFHHFTKDIGDRYEEWNEVETTTWEFKGKLNKILPPDHPLLLEAELWVDQATCSFYPEFFEYAGPGTRLPNLLHVLTLGRSWLSRGYSHDDLAKGEQDFRRVVRLGRLMLQDDLIMLQDLIGIALVRIGCDALYDSARQRGDATETTLAALAIYDATAIRLETKRRIDLYTEYMSNLKKVDPIIGKPTVELTMQDEDFEVLLRAAENEPDRALRIEAMLPLWIIKFYGAEAQKEKAATLLSKLENNDDPIVAAAAKWHGSTEATYEMFTEMYSIK